MPKLNRALITLTLLLMGVSLTSCDFSELRESIEREAQYEEAATLAERMMLDSAMTLLNDILDQDPEHVSSLILRGDIYNRLEMNDEASKDFLAAIRLDPANSDAYSGLAGVKMDTGDLEGALEDANKSIELGPTLARAYNVRALVKQALNDSFGAEADMRRSLSLEETAVIHYNLAWLFYETGKQDSSKVHVERCIRMNPYHYDAFNLRANIRETAGDTTGALKDYQLAINLAPYDPVLFVNRGLLYMDMKEYQKAKEDLDQAISLSPEMWEAYYHRSTTLEHLQDHAAALADYDVLIENATDMDMADLYFYRALQHKEMGHDQEACADMQQAYELGLAEAELELKDFCG